jgi:hypothetical protein
VTPTGRPDLLATGVVASASFAGVSLDPGTDTRGLFAEEILTGLLPVIKTGDLHHPLSQAVSDEKLPIEESVKLKISLVTLGVSELWAPHGIVARGISFGNVADYGDTAVSSDAANRICPPRRRQRYYSMLRSPSSHPSEYISTYGYGR